MKPRRFLALFAAVLLWPAGAFGQSGPIGRSYPISEGPTPAGITVLHLPLPKEERVVLQFRWTDEWALSAGRNLALPALGPQLMLDGAGAGLDGRILEEDLKDLRAGLSLSTGRASTLGQLSAPRDEFDKAVQLLRGVLDQPPPRPATLARLKRRLLSDLRQGAERPSTLAGQMLGYLTLRDHPLRFLDRPPEAAIDALSMGDVTGWRNAVLAKKNLIVVAAGPLSREEAVAWTDAAFGGLPAEPAIVSPNRLTVHYSGRTIVLERPVAQTTILLTGPTPWSAGLQGVQRQTALSILGGGPSSRLFRTVRDDLGAAYGISAGISTVLGERHALAISTSVDNDKAAAALAAIRREYARFLAEGPTEAEVAPLRARATTSFRDAMNRSDQASGAIMGFMVAGLGANEINRRQARIAGLTAPDVAALVRDRFPPVMTAVIVAPSAAGLDADCVIGTLDEIARCAN